LQHLKKRPIATHFQPTLFGRQTLSEMKVIEIAFPSVAIPARLSTKELIDFVVDSKQFKRLDRINGTREDDRDGRRPKISFTTTMIPISAMQAKCTTRQNRRSCCLPAPSAARAQYCLAGLRRLELRYPCASHVFEMS
jgi:hypothetical protein